MEYQCNYHKGCLFSIVSFNSVLNVKAVVAAFNQVLRDCENFADGSLAALIQTVWRWILVSGGGAGGIYHPHTGHSTHVLYLETVFKLKHLLPNVSMSSCQPNNTYSTTVGNKTQKTSMFHHHTLSHFFLEDFNTV